MFRQLRLDFLRQAADNTAGVKVGKVPPLMIILLYFIIVEPSMVSSIYQF